MKRWFVRLVLLCAVVSALGLASAFRVGPGKNGQGVDLSGTFEATVHVGPDRGLTLRGQFTAHVTPQGRLTGRVTPKKGRAVAVVGQITGLAVNLAFTLGAGRYLFGVGTSLSEIKPGTMGEMGGPLTGPRGGDLGDWLLDTCPSWTRGTSSS
jgi:hypothetical protein